jgi:hypothetical protein
MVNDSSRLFKRSSATANSAAPWCRHARVLPRRGAAVHISAAIVATATLSIAVRSATLLFTTAFTKVHVDRSARVVPMVLRGLFEKRWMTTEYATP